ncbi:GNAT family N-acetyltransferase [Streptococcus ovis]|uniref:GNAT family N-acetyltransferase n=1 Tax=Streptococcus ovis TaxID=82806 RepID=UPI00036F86F0|nr:GNAT family N-acetyltransferase [Streptococcus ovis]
MIRPMVEKDSEAICQLNNEELDYDLDREATTRNIARLLESSQHCLLVAEVDGQVAGYVHAQLYETLYFKPLWNVLGLAVASCVQGQGIGRELMVALEDSARQAGVAGIRVNSGINRRGAHEFYRALGYQERPDQKRFLKEL